MVKFSNDADILKYEPILFGEFHLPWQIISQGTGGVILGTGFTAADADFITANVSPGQVIYLSNAALTIDGAFEIVSVDSATQLTVSVLRVDSQSNAVAPPQGSDINYRISTFDPQACEAAFALTEFFAIKPGAPASDIEAEDILAPDVLKRASVFAVISAVYAMLTGRNDDEAFWKKSNYYRKCFESARATARLSIDTGDDGIAERTSSGGAIRLTRD
ncbi:MAG: hypothetical protein WC374_02415 [Phycisphaerae bacterium]|jgi:hypothetical protein